MSEVNSEYGTVQWFDQKKGFGFVKVLKPDSEYFEKEVFVHYTSIQADNTFKKLYPGENVSLTVRKNEDESSDKEFVSSNVRGVLGLPLLVDNTEYIYRVIKKKFNQEPEPEPESEE
jgi:cold shock CspA family protein